jgi:hypothetical protein
VIEGRPNDNQRNRIEFRLAKEQQRPQVKRELADTLRVVHEIHVRRVSWDSQVLDRFETPQHPLGVHWERAVIVGRGHRADGKSRCR